MKTTSLLQKLTVICMTYERHSFVRRQLAYFRNFPIKIIFADGSSKHLGIDSQGKMGLLEWRYLHIPGEDFRSRLSSALDIVSTDYLCLTPDDDIMLGSGLKLAVKELEKKSDLIFAGGKVGRFVSQGNLQVFCKESHWTDDFSLMSNDPGYRLLSLIESVRTANVYYVVARTVELKSILQKSMTLLFSYNGATELIISGLLSVKSKYQIGQYPFWMRGDEPSTVNKNYWKIDGHSWYIQCPEEVQCMKEILSKALIEQGYSPDYASSTVDQYLNTHHQQLSRKGVHIFSWFFLTIYIKKILTPSIVRVKVYNIFMKSNETIMLLLSRFFGKDQVIRLLKKSLPKTTMDFTMENPSSDIVEFWTKYCGQLNEEQKLDLLNVYSLLQKFPRGIDSNQVLLDLIRMEEN